MKMSNFYADIFGKLLTYRKNSYCSLRVRLESENHSRRMSRGYLSKGNPVVHAHVFNMGIISGHRAVVVQLASTEEA
jgi:hypothetical protein